MIGYRALTVALLPWIWATANAASPLHIEGLDDELLDNVLAFIALDEQPCTTPQWQLQRRLRAVDRPIADALAAFGYYQVTLEKSANFDDEACWSATIVVERGPQTTLRTVDVQIEGAAEQDPQIQAIVKSAPAPGQPLHHGRYDAYKTRLRQALAARGYVDARFERAELSVYPHEQKADIALVVVSGPRFEFGALNIEQDVLDEALVRRYLSIRTGEPFDRARLSKLQRDLAGTAYFDRVLVRADYDAITDNQVPVSIELTATENLGYFVGIGASTDQGPRVRGGYRDRRVNRRGHQFESGLQLSPVLSRLDASYRQPLENPLAEWQTIRLQFENEETDTSLDKRAQVGIERTLALHNDWLFSYGISLGESSFEVGEVDDRSTLLIPVVGLTRRISDDESNPRSGSALELRLQAASRSALSSTDFVQAYARYRRLFAIGAHGRLSLRAEFGTTLQREFDELPPSVRFFAGGDNSVRGYGYEQIGPEDDSGTVIGGSNLATASIEYEQTLRGAWGAAVFLDTGNAFDDANINPRTGVGIGVVWRSPVGPLRAYLAHPLDDDRTVRLHVSFGADL